MCHRLGELESVVAAADSRERHTLWRRGKRTPWHPQRRRLILLFASLGSSEPKGPLHLTHLTQCPFSESGDVLRDVTLDMLRVQRYRLNYLLRFDMLHPKSPRRRGRHGGGERGAVERDGYAVDQRRRALIQNSTDPC